LRDKSKQDENKDMLAFRHALSLQKKAKENQDEVDRRQSLFNRGEYAQIQKEKGTEMNKYVFYHLLLDHYPFVYVNFIIFFYFLSFLEQNKTSIEIYWISVTHLAFRRPRRRNRMQRREGIV
jgi:hypothetical protein